MRHLLTNAVLCLVLSAGACTSTGRMVLSATGDAVDPTGADAGELVVLVFSSPDCPIANALTPELERLHLRVSEAGGDFYLVHVRTDVTSAAALEHARARGMTMQLLLDGDHTLVERFGATVTPEGFVLVRDDDRWREVYQGRINDLYAAIGDRRDSATRHYLREAIDAAAAGESVRPAYRAPIGCFIESMP